jgi:hypothetical protein
LLRCLAIDVLFLRAFAPTGMCLLSRCVAMGIHVTIFNAIRNSNITPIITSVINPYVKQTVFASAETMTVNVNSRHIQLVSDSKNRY